MSLSLKDDGNLADRDATPSEARVRASPVRPPFHMTPRERFALAGDTGIDPRTIMRWEMGLRVQQATETTLELAFKKRGFAKQPVTGPVPARRRRIVDVGGKAA